MEIILKDIANQIYRFNDFLDKKALSDGEIEEEKENSEDFLELKNKFKKILNELENSKLEDLGKNNKNLIELHVLMCDLTWYIENLHQNLQKIIKEYPCQE